MGSEEECKKYAENIFSRKNLARHLALTHDKVTYR